MDFKAIGQGVTVTVLAAIILGPLGYFATLLITPDAQTVRGSIEWIDFPNPLPRRLSEKVPNAEQLLKDTFGVSNLLRYSEVYLTPATNLRVARVQLVNFGAVRSKPVEIAAVGFALFSVSAVDGNATVRSDIRLKPIDSEESTDVYMIGSAGYLSFDPNIKVIHDDRPVRLIPLSGRENKSLLRLVADNPNLVTVFIVIAMGAITIAAIILIGSVIVRLFVSSKYELEARFSTAAQIKDKLEFIEYVRKNYPDKVPNSLTP